MKRIILISCVSKKRTRKSKAKDLYISALFKKNLQYAWQQKPDQIFILSAKYGLVTLDEEIEPYDLTLKRMPASEVKQWAAKVTHQLAEHTDLQEDLFVFLAGAIYRKYLIPHLAHVEIPFEHADLFKQLQQLTKQGKTSHD